MKLSLFFLVVAGFHAAIARDVEPEMKEVIVSEIQQVQESRSEMATRKRELRSRIQKLAAKAPEAARLRAELDETRQLLSALTEQEKDLQTRLKKLLSSPEHRVTNAIANDKRHPTKANISGVWTSGPNLVGYTIQLEQRATSVTGKGFYWGCLGTYDLFEITGSYKENTLSLTFVTSLLKREKHIYHYGEENDRPRFRLSDSKRQERIMPVYELH